MARDPQNDTALGILGLIQLALCVWWSYVAPFPKHVILAMWIVMLELSMWFSVWRREKP